MRLIRAQVTNYKCIEDSTEFDVDQVTCLVGKNESGKTTLLQALYKLNPHRAEDRSFDKDQDYPRRFVNEYSERHPKNDAEILRTVWALDDDDRDALRPLFGGDVDGLEEVVITRTYSGTLPTFNASVSEASAVSHLLATSTLYEEERGKLAAATSVAALKKAIEKLGDAKTERHGALLETIAKLFGRGTAVTGAIDVLYPRMPKFVFFSQYQRMPGRVHLESTQERVDEGQQLQDGEKTFLDFCAFAGSSLDELASIDSFEKLRAKFEAASSRITRELFEYWTQNQDLRVQFSRDAGEPGDPPPYNKGRVFNVRVWNNLHEVSVPFDDRSAGFVWFFSFLVLFSQVRKTFGENLILLLDEPGVSLHAKAQDDLLRFIDKRLKPHHQVIYSTHSPFMVPPSNLPSVRTVEDVVERPRDGRPIVRGTKVTADVLKVDRDTLFPVQGALGYEITQSLFVGRNTLLVEGPSDLLYLHLFSSHLKSAGREGLDARWVICPVGGIDKVPAFMALFGANRLRLAVFVDVAKGQKAKVQEMKRMADEVLRSGQVFTPTKYVGADEADTEDLLGVDGYIHLVNAAYGLQGSSAIPVPATRPSRLMSYVQEEMRLRAEFNHYAPAEYLTKNSASMMTSLPGITDALDRFEAFFKEVNPLTAKDS